MTGSHRSPIKIVECPRDAMQGINDFIPTQKKIEYLNQLLKVGFDTLDFGSFVSPKAVPQLADTKEVLDGLDTSGTSTDLLAIVVNERGAKDACQFPEIRYLGYPFSISETFQLRNTRKTIKDSFDIVKRLQALCTAHDKQLLVYLSMGFGNPYGDPWSPEIAEHWTQEMVTLGLGNIALADTAGVSAPDNIAQLFGTLIPRFPGIQFSAHFHSHPSTREEKLAAAWEHGCRKFDTAMLGFGGCPFAEDELVGNISTESLVYFCKKYDIHIGISDQEFHQATTHARQVFG